MSRKRTLIPSPLQWDAVARMASPPPIPVLAERGGTQLRTPLPTAIVDTREQNPLSLERFPGWFEKVEHRALPLGDYSVAGMEEVCAVERKDLTDLVQSFTINRSVFIDRLRRMSQLPHSLLVITASLREIKSEYPYSPASPNRIMQSLIAVLRGCAYRLSAPRPTNSGRKSWHLTSIRPSCTTGSIAMAMGGFWRMEICSIPTLKKLSLGTLGSTPADSCSSS